MNFEMLISLASVYLLIKNNLDKKSTVWNRVPDLELIYMVIGMVRDVG